MIVDHSGLGEMVDALGAEHIARGDRVNHCEGARASFSEPSANGGQHRIRAAQAAR